ncbi:MAG: leucine-rich repeat domain-containing protein [Bacteroidota bacterium]
MKKLYSLLGLLFCLPPLWAQSGLLSEEELAKQPVYTNLKQAYQVYDRVYRLTIKGTGGYYGKVDEVPLDIDTLLHLQYFQVVNEALERLPPRFGNLEELQQLYLGGNQFQALPDTLYNLRNLKRLDVQKNRLLRISDKIGQLIHLEYLYLNDNRELDFLPTEAFKNLRQLKILNAHNTKIPREQLEKIQEMLPKARVEY